MFVFVWLNDEVADVSAEVLYGGVLQSVLNLPNMTKMEYFFVYKCFSNAHYWAYLNLIIRVSLSDLAINNSWASFSHSSWPHELKNHDI